MDKISIALCTYNGAKFLPEQLESYLKQTRLPDELIVCDDCSSDDTVKIIEKFARNSPFPVCLYINEKNLRSTKNFEKAISLCTGDLIFLSDQDDYWMPEKLEKIEAEFNKNKNVGMVFSDAELVDENLQSLNRRVWEHTFTNNRRKSALSGKMLEVLLGQNVVTGATMSFRAEQRKNFLPIPENVPNLIHDGWISLLIVLNSKIAFIDEPLIKYRQHSSQQLGIDYQTNLKTDFKQRKKRFAKSINFYRDEIERLNQLEKLFPANSRIAKCFDGDFFDKLKMEKEEKITHYEARMNLPLSRIGRFFPVSNEILTGRYHRFSRGFLSAAKDLFEKW